MQDAQTAAGRRRRVFDLAVWLGLILGTFAVYAQVAGCDFVDYDDNLYVYQNPHVQEGLTPASVRWALTAVVSNNWMPVTLLSHVLDGELFGMRSGLHHLENVLFHALAAGLLYAALHRATGARGASAFVAFAFALHPLHVGSVAWVSERKDVLSAFFWFLALYAYVRYAEQPGAGRYLLVAAAFCLGLLSKPMLVTFPFTLLLLDFWPLRRTQWPKLVLEKAPLPALSAGASAVTYFVQASTGAMMRVPPAARLANVFISYAMYIRQMFWPTRLAFFYPYPHTIPAWKAGVAAAALLVVTALAMLTWRARPYFAVGWFWYLGTLVPVIGLVQVGMQAHADRYMYIPMAGLLVILAWGAADVVGKWPRTKPAIAAAAVLCCTVCAVGAWKEAGYWQNSETLFERAIAVTQDNWVAEYNLGHYLLGAGRGAEAVPHFQAALRFKPDYAAAHNNLGAALLRQQGCAAAIPHFEAAVRAQPDFADASYNLGGCLMSIGNYADAVPYFEAAVHARSGYAEAHYNLGVTLSKIPGREKEAIAHLEAAERIRPDAGTEGLLDRLRGTQR